MRVPMDKYLKILPYAPTILAQYALPKQDRAPAVSEGSQLRKLLGFQPQQKLNIVILFLESGRAYELLNPKTRDEVYPEFRSVLAQYGVFFSQAYSTANYTVQGQFSTLCSRMDRFDTAPTYSRQPYNKVKCLPSVFSENQYETYWMNPYSRYFSGKYVFESNHGMDHFMDREVFKPRTAEEAHDATEWGVSDEVFLSQALDQLEEIHQKGKPFFAHLLTTGTHAPWHKLAKYPLSQSLKDWSHGSDDYEGYLSTAKGLDHALGEFFKRFMESPVSNDTVIIVTGDHGTGVLPPNAHLDRLQRNLIWPRIILGVVSKKIQHPEVISDPVHQIDIAPLAVELAGLPQDPSWLGRNPLLTHVGTPWVKRNGNRFLYRTRDRICGKISVSEPIQCWGFQAKRDPLFETGAPVVSEDATETAQYRAVIDANEAVLELTGSDEPSSSRVAGSNEASSASKL
jgi:phosphoglycerol transferase MdoB-like AlkP superfamily enzyme